MSNHKKINILIIDNQTNLKDELKALEKFDYKVETSEKL